MQRDLRQLMLVNGTEANAAAKTSMEAADKRYQDSIETITPMFKTKQGQELLGAVNAAYANWKPYLEKMAAMAVADDNDGAITVLLSADNIASTQAFDTAIQNLVNRKREQAT